MKRHILSDPLFLEQAKINTMPVRDSRNCHFGGRSWNTLGECRWGLAVRVVDQMEIPSMQDTHAKVLFFLEVLIRVQAVPATPSWKLEHDGPPAIYTRPRTDSTSTLSMPQPKTVIKIV
jgi:hypothetical protein